MATVTVYTAEHMQEIENATIIGASVVNGELIFERHDGTLLNVGGIFNPISGTAAALASSNLVYHAGQLVQQTDGAKLLAMGDGVTAYNSLPKYSMGDAGAYQYTYTETLKTGQGTTISDWTGLTITFTSDGVTPIEVEAFCPFVRGEASTTLPAYGTLVIMEGATQIADGTSSGMTIAGANGIGSGIIAKDTRIYSAGSHTLKVQVARSTLGGGAGTLTFFALAGFRAYIRSKLAHL